MFLYPGYLCRCPETFPDLDSSRQFAVLLLSLFAILFFFDFALFCSVITGSINHTNCVDLITLSGYLCVSYTIPCLPPLLYKYFIQLLVIDRFERII
jgi:hypothetical protein